MVNEMSATLDFPSNCPTNVYTLNDFGEIAYIVCTAAAPPTHDPSAFVATPENILARLRKTERQFRDNSILAALDVDARQLFTFYKKVDITAPRDQKALLLKFGYVLRSNSCTIAYKTAARLPDLMKPEQARLFRLFITAIVSSIKLLPAGGNALQPVGPNLYLVETASSTTERDQFPQAQKWILYRIDLQVVLSGHIILTIAKDEDLSFLPVHTHPPELDGGDNCSDVTAVYLAPIGRIARASRSRLSSQSTLNGDKTGKHNGESQVDKARREVWKDLLPLWLREHMNIAIQSNDFPWVEVEVGLEEFDRLSNEIKSDTAPAESVHADSITWRTIFWPANLCFLLNIHEPDHKSIAASNQDPMQFVRDWILGAGSAASKIEPGRGVLMDEDDEPLFAEEGAFDDQEHFQPFGPPAFPPSQTIYPTPPDVGMTHPTPGLSSVDGIAMTPANLPGSSAEQGQQQDEDMPDFEDVPPASGISSYYDEDLFEEMPDDNFGQGTNGDEPNWDFFDGPGARSKASRSASHSRMEGSTSRGDPKQERVEPGNGRDEHGQFSRRSITAKKETSTLGSTLNLTMADQAQPPSSQVAQSSNILPSDEKGITPSPPRPAPPLWQNNTGGIGVSDTNSRRRTSVFDGAKPVSSIPKHDSRYDADGDFWFDPSPILAKSKMQPKPISVSRRPPSSPSGSCSSMSSTSESLDTRPGIVGPTLFRQWTQYSPESLDGSNHRTDFDKKAIQQDMQQILGLLKPGLVDPPTVSDFQLDERDAYNDSPTTSQKTQHIAQVLVDQMSQTSLILHGEHQGGRQILGDDRFDMHIDLTGINTSAGPSNLSQLISLKADHSGARIHGRVTKLRPNQICLRRVERPLTASMSVLKFWDTLSLQPEHGPKDLTAFCVHPRPENVKEGSLNLLHRLTDAYTTCALGTHIIGRLPSLSEDGLISWDPDGPHEHDLLRTTTAIGNGLAATSTITGTVVVYMISRGESPTAYLEMCIAFYNLFESFTKARTDDQHISDIQLQIIPQSFVANMETLVIPPQTAYLKLAVEIYNRLPPLDLAGPPAACGSAVVLARSENSVRFQLTTTYGSPLDKNGPCLHLAYSASQDKKWLTAVWTDELGRIALSMSYCSHVRESSKRRPRHEIFKEMWEVSQDLMSKVRGPWRLAVVRNGFYEPAEPTEWHQIFDSSPASQKRCLLLLLSIQLHPDLTIFPSLAQGKPQSGAHNQYGTPASTPQASITSPDQMVPATPTPGGSSFMNASTPPDPAFDPSNESDLLVVDPSDESWGIILPYGANQSRNMTELRPSQVTALLLKRRGLKGEDGYTMVETSLLRSTSHIPNKLNENASDDLVDDLIRQYRGLVTLGATRGCVDPNLECLPWHIATAIRGARILEQAM